MPESLYDSFIAEYYDASPKRRRARRCGVLGERGKRIRRAGAGARMRLGTSYSGDCTGRIQNRGTRHFSENAGSSGGEACDFARRGPDPCEFGAGEHDQFRAQGAVPSQTCFEVSSGDYSVSAISTLIGNTAAAGLSAVRAESCGSRWAPDSRFLPDRRAANARSGIPERTQGCGI